MPKTTPGTDNRVLKVCRLLNEHQVRYILAGGVAANLHGSVGALAGTLRVRPSALLAEAGPQEWRARALLRKAQRIATRNPGTSFEDIWHTLVLMEEEPAERLRRSLLRGRALDLH